MMAEHQVVYLRRSGSWRMFFFSSRRRHTRSLCDWSSDVCSSDLAFASFPCFLKCDMSTLFRSNNSSESGRANKSDINQQGAYHECCHDVSRQPPQVDRKSVV